MFIPSEVLPGYHLCHDECCLSFLIRVCVCVLARACMRVHACLRACTCACMRVCAAAYHGLHYSQPCLYIAILSHLPLTCRLLLRGHRNAGLSLDRQCVPLRPPAHNEHAVTTDKLPAPSQHQLCSGTAAPSCLVLATAC